MRKFTIVGDGDGIGALRCDGTLLCFLNPDVFKWPDLEKGEVIQVKELPLQKAGTLRTEETNYDSLYYIQVDVKVSGHCALEFERFTTKRFHLPPGGSMPVSTIKLLLKPRR